MGNCFGKPKRAKNTDLDESPKTLPREVVTVEQLVPEKIEAFDKHVSFYNSHEEVTPEMTSEKPSSLSDSLLDEQIELAVQKFNVDVVISQALKEMDGEEIIVYDNDAFATQDTTEQLLSEQILSVDQSVEVLDDSTSESELAEILMKSKDNFFSKTISLDIPKDVQKSVMPPKFDTDDCSVDSIDPPLAIKLENKTTVSDIPSSLNSSRRGSLAMPLDQYSTRIDASKMTMAYQELNEEDLQPADKTRASSVAYPNIHNRFGGVVKKSASASDNLCKVVTDIYTKDTNNNCITPQNEQLEMKNRFDEILDEQLISKKQDISGDKIGEEAKQFNEQMEDMTGRLEKSLLEKLEQFKKLSDEFLNRGDLSHLSPSKNESNASKILNETVQSNDSDVNEVEPALNVTNNTSNIFSPSMSPLKRKKNRPNRRRSKKKKLSERPIVAHKQDDQPVIRRCIERQASFNYN